jgi:putrescine transport system substrate-binding protein
MVCKPLRAALASLLVVTAAALPAEGVHAAQDEATEEKVLNFYNWADYIGPDTIADFEAEYGIEVNYDIFDATAVVEAKLLAGKTGYDVVLHTMRYSARLIPIGVFKPLQLDRLPNRRHLDPWVMERLAQKDPGNRHAIPYMWGTTGFMYNVDMIRERMPDAPVDSAAMLFEPEIVRRFADCGVTWLDESTTVIPLVMLYLGHDPHSIDEGHLAEAEALLKATRPYIRYISSGMGLNDMGNKEICISMAWSGDYTQAQNRANEAGVDIHLAYTAPREGTVMFFDNLLIPADAPHPQNAHLFLDFLMRPEVIGPISDATGYGNANKDSLPYVSARLANDPAAWPPMEARALWQVDLIYGPKEERPRSRVWSRVKAGL